MEFVYEDSDEALAKQRIGEVLAGRWKLESLLGVGGMAAVYAGVDPDGRRAAVKVLHPHMNRRRDIRQRFLREGSAASRIAHPGIVQVLEECSAGEATAALVMELLEGQSLTGLLESRAALPMPELLDILDQILDALAAAHDAGIVHRDLKPDNLFVTKEGRVKILDFGIARVLESIPSQHLTKTGMTLGTVPFMSPEQALGKRDLIDGRTDLFAVGAIAFRIVTGRYIHQEDTDGALLVAMASRPAPPLRSVHPGAPAELAAVIDLSLAFSRESRYPDARTMQADVRALSQGRPPPFAMRKLSVREQSTRVDMAVPAVAPGSAGLRSARSLPSVPQPPSGPPVSSATRVAPSLSAATAQAPSPPVSSATRVAPSLSAATAQAPSPPVSSATRVAPSLSAPTAVAAVPGAITAHAPPSLASAPEAPLSRAASAAAGSGAPSLASVVSQTPPPVAPPARVTTGESPTARGRSRSTLYIAALLGVAAVGGLAYALGSGSDDNEALPAAIEELPADEQPSERASASARAPAQQTARTTPKRAPLGEGSDVEERALTLSADRSAAMDSLKAALAKSRDSQKEERKREEERRREQKKGGKYKER